MDSDDYENACRKRHSRFDRRFFIGVLSTSIYCRPGCPAGVPRKENVKLYKSAAAASAAGFQPCLRCRPEAFPSTTAWHGSSWKIYRALRLIDQGFLDEQSVEELAEFLKVGPRQLIRLFNDHLGASPVEVAQTRRLHFAKKLIVETHMSFSDVSFAAGFGSLGGFNAALRKTYKLSPTQLREKCNVDRKKTERDDIVECTVPYCLPFDWAAMLSFFAYRAVPGVEVVTAYSYARTFCLEGEAGHFEAFFEPASHQIRMRITYPEIRYLRRIIDRVCSLFDLKADSNRIDQFLAKDSELAPMVRRFPGLRVPGCWSGFEVAVRAILGQQITVKAASTLVARIVERYGKAYQCCAEGLQFTFPEPAQLVDADLTGMGIVGQRIAAIQAVAGQIGCGELDIEGGMDPDNFVRTICSIKGIGEWTAQYIAMRALNDPNAFPYSDLILRRAVSEPGVTMTPKALLKRAESWQPWRAYCVMLLWRNYAS